ncbi:serine/threonine-protein kinase [Kitasatospora sp. CM 4170]|uniref:non-specific serine/threonine protein kinase n=1 Tax=Kitasatospora aburaviensis TaxID=67265 RepID=A0ABW1EYM8_9ACTN|nr:serine/threonine-protein kinase [Kitasatospora sp. CM 4170]WNM48175.1 serine/threonine-protein kinase [Kitasatospora sp. CM 4170]
MSSRGTELGGRYTLTERIGGGGMGSVWRADDRVLARRVAVKILHPGLVEDGTFVQRFRREAQLLAGLKHPGIVDVHDYGESGGDGEERTAYIVMELVEGRPLDKVLAEGGPMEPERALGLLATALDALAAAHRQDIVHRDVKPSNLMLRPDGQVTVTDFGIARAVASTKLTASHAVIGTALYMAPEQAEGKSVAPASDLYSIGVVAYELLTGKPPFVGESVLEVALKHLREPVPELPAAFPAAVREVVARALAKQPEERFADAAAMAAAARAAIGAEPGPAAAGADGAAGGAAAGGAAKAATGGAPAPAAAAPTPDAPAGGAAGEVGQVKDRDATEPGTRRRRHGFLVPVVLPVVITATTATVLLIDRAPFSSNAETPNGQPPVVVTAPATTGGTPPATGSPTTPPPSTPPPTGTPAPETTTPAPGTQPAPAAGNQPGTVPNPGGGAVAGGAAGGGGAAAGGQGTPPRTGGAAGGGGNGGSGSGSATGGGGTNGGGAVPPPAATQAPPAATSAPQPPPATTAPQQPSVPAGCGGSKWGSIVSVASGLKLGLSKDSPVGGQAVVMGGTTAYGWVRSDPNPGGWYQIYPCNLSGPALVQETDGRVSLSGGFSVLNNWTVAAASTPGAFALKDYMGQSCLTDNGAGRQATMVTCTPGNKSQEFRIP